MSRDRGPRAFLEATGSVLVLFWLSWRLAPICSIVVVVTALAAAAYKKHTKTIEQEQGKALQSMTGVALQALENMRTVRSAQQHRGRKRMHFYHSQGGRGLPVFSLLFDLVQINQ